MMRAWVVTIVGAAMCAGSLSGQDTRAAVDPGRPVVEAARATAGIVIDGRLEEAVWATAVPATDFTQVDPEEGQPVSERTEARILFDKEAMYVGVRFYDREPVSARLGRRDMALSDSDWLGVVIDSYHDHRTGFSFDVNPSGVQRDALKSMVGGQEIEDLSWDGVWEAAAHVDDEGWTAEYRIPFSQLRFTESAEPVWGIQIERVIGRRREYSVLSFTPKTEQGGIPAFAHLVGMTDIEPGHRLELLPYGVTRAEYVEPGANPFRGNSEYFGSAGLDALYRVSPQMTLNATLNPDFGQVEVDPAVVNLSVYETFFEEKRPFFIEGSEIFDFGRNTSGGQLFYSRRIGRRPQLGAPSAAADLPDATTILGAGKLSGKTQNGWSIGVLEAVTGEETARYMTDAGTADEAIVEPLTNYFVGRVRKDGGGGRSSIGGMLTATNRRLSTDVLSSSLRESAYAGGIDFRHEFGDRTWFLEGGVIASRIAGDPASILRVQRAGNHFFQRPDAEHLEVDEEASSLTGYSVGLSLGKQAGQHWRGNVEVAATSPEFEVNDLGFQTRTDRRDAQLGLSYVETQPGSFFRSWGASARVRYEHNYANQRVLNFWAFNWRFRHLNFWSAQIGLNFLRRSIDDRSTRGGPLLERPQTTGVFINGSTDPRKPVTLSFNVNGGRDVYDGWSTGTSFTVGLKTSPRWNLSLTPNLQRGLVQAQYVGTVEDASAAATFGARYLFAPLRLTTLSMVTRFDFTFTPRLTLQLYAQPFISSGDYAEIGSLARPQSYEFEPWAGQAPNLDFNLRSLRGTAVVRWEWKPGSTLYLAWQQTRADFASGVGDFDFGRDRRALFAADPDNIFVLKVNYWITP